MGQPTTPRKHSSGAGAPSYTRARSDCGPGEELGYVSYPLAGGGYDRTYGFCYPDGL
ncbi:hypothetical protein [Myxococcus xanthus]|uniref:hypothetical protein n=1 Tax=Myxococcus xanthus TaxID=34 RepID=UPI001375AE54|nr:hypothetical protein [Myxococcus xanthus]